MNETLELENELLQTKFPKECEAIPINELEPDEQNVCNKCINHEELTSEEFTLLKKVLQEFRPVINELKPEETIQNVEDTINVITTEKELLDILDNPERNKLIVDLPLDDKKYRFEFTIEPLNDSRAIQNLQTQIDIFRDYTEKEQEVYSKGTRGSKLSRAEKLLYNKMSTEINKKLESKQDETIINVLANQLKLSNSTQDINERIRFWKVFPYNVKVAVFMKVQDRLGLTNVRNEELFPVQ